MEKLDGLFHTFQVSIVNYVEKEVKSRTHKLKEQREAAITKAIRAELKAKGLQIKADNAETLANAKLSDIRVAHSELQKKHAYRVEENNALSKAIVRAEAEATAADSRLFNLQTEMKKIKAQIFEAEADAKAEAEKETEECKDSPTS